MHLQEGPWSVYMVSGLTLNPKSADLARRIVPGYVGNRIGFSGSETTAVT